MNSDGSCDNTWAAPNTLSWMSGTPPVRVYVDCAGWYYSPNQNYVQVDHVHASAMAFTQGERRLLAGDIPDDNPATGEWAVVERIHNDGIFAYNFGW